MLLSHTALTDLYSVLNTNFKEKRYYLFITAQLPTDVCTQEAQERVVPADFCSAVRFQGLWNEGAAFKTQTLPSRTWCRYPHLKAEESWPKEQVHQNFAGKVKYSYKDCEFLLSMYFFNLPSF